MLCETGAARAAAGGCLEGVFDGCARKLEASIASQVVAVFPPVPLRRLRRRVISRGWMMERCRPDEIATVGALPLSLWRSRLDHGDSPASHVISRGTTMERSRPDEIATVEVLPSSP